MSHPEHESLQDLAAAYALGALSPEEARRFEAHLAGSPEAQREVAEYRDVAALLALASPGTPPAADLRERVLARLRTQPASASGVRRRPSRPWGALAAALVAVLGLGFGYVQLREGRDLRARLAQTMERLAETSERLASREATLDRILGPGVQMAQLTAGGDPDPGVQLFWDRERHRAILHGYRLEPVPAGRAYQLWFIRDGAPVPSVTFKPEPNGQVNVEEIPLPADGELSAAAVTVEPESGSPQPTSPVLLVGPLERS
jgi:anti-sigma-K factor RskA